MSIFPQIHRSLAVRYQPVQHTTEVQMRPWYVQVLVHLALLSVAVLFTYWGMWRAYFATLDDFGITGWVRSRESLWMAMQGYGSGVRFLNYVPIWFKTQWFGLNAAPYLWSGLVQYLLVVALVYALAQQIWKERVLSFVATLLFAVSYAHYEVVTYVSASDYTLWAAFYLAIVLLFLRYLERGGLRNYAGAVVLYGCLAFGHDFTLSLPLLLLATHAILHIDFRQLFVGDRSVRHQWLRQIVGQVVQLHFPFWLLWATHVGLQFVLVMGGTSEAVYSANGYALGLHMVANLRYLIFLWFPNLTLGPIYSFLSEWLPLTTLDLLWQICMVMGTLLHLILAWIFWKGNHTVRVAIALIYLPFLQYTPWQGHFIEAPRYLLLPSVGAALLLGCGWGSLSQRLYVRQMRAARLLVSGAAVLFCLANVLVIQIWVQQHVANGRFRRGFVTELAERYPTTIGPNTRVWIEVPEEKYTDLADSCRLVFQQYYVPCVTYLAGDPPPTDPSVVVTEDDFLWLQATTQGIVQHYPPDD